MKLKSLNCNNCGNPLREENGKLHCDVCGSDFDIEVDFEAKKMERIQQSLENSRESIEADKRALEEFQRAKDEAEIRAEQERRARLEESLRAMRKRSLAHTFKVVGVTLAVCVIGIVAMYALLRSLDSSSKKSKKAENQTTVTTVAKNYRITPSELKKEGAFVEELTKKTVEKLKEDHSGSVLESTDEALYIWNLSADPYVVKYYLLTRDDGNYLYMLMALPMKGDNNSPNSDEVREKEMYVMAYVEDLAIDADGKFSYRDDKIMTEGSSKYNFFWHADSDADVLIAELITEKETDQTKGYVLHEFTM